MPVRDFPPRPQGAEPDSVPMQNWLDTLGNRQSIDMQQELTSVDSADELLIFDVSETGQVKTKKATVANLGGAVLAGGIDLASQVTGTLPVANGGTGQTSYTNGQLLIGNTTGNTLTKATLTAGAGVSITNGAGAITISASGGITELIAPTSFPSANSVDITSIPQTYAALLLVINGLSFDTATRALRMRISSDNGSTVNTGGFHGNYINNTSVTAAGGGSSPITPAAQTAAQVTTTLVLITGYQAGSFIHFECAGLDQDSVSHSSNTTFITDTNAVNCLRLIMNSTGNFDAGTYALYGVS